MPIIIIISIFILYAFLKCRYAGKKIKMMEEEEEALQEKKESFDNEQLGSL
jgi:hypothetical protein